MMITKNYIKVARAAELLTKLHLISPAIGISCVNDMACRNNTDIDEDIQDMRMDMGFNNVSDEVNALDSWTGEDKPKCQPENLLDNALYPEDDCVRFHEEDNTVRAVTVKDMFQFTDNVIVYLKKLSVIHILS